MRSNRGGGFLGSKHLNFADVKSAGRILLKILYPPEHLNEDGLGLEEILQFPPKEELQYFTRIPLPCCVGPPLRLIPLAMLRNSIEIASCGGIRRKGGLRLIPRRRRRGGTPSANPPLRGGIRGGKNKISAPALPP